MGGNRQAAIYAGINPDRTVLKVFLVEGLLLGVAGILKATTAQPAHALGVPGPGDDLHCGGGGRRGEHHGRLGQAAGAVFGALLVYLLSITMIYLGFQDYFQFALQGIIILIAVFITVTDFGAAAESGCRKAFAPRRAA